MGCCTVLKDENKSFFVVSLCSFGKTQIIVQNVMLSLREWNCFLEWHDSFLCKNGYLGWFFSGLKIERALFITTFLLELCNLVAGLPFTCHIVYSKANLMTDILAKEGQMVYLLSISRRSGRSIEKWAYLISDGDLFFEVGWLRVLLGLLLYFSLWSKSIN